MFQRVLLSLVAFNVGVFVAKTKKVILPCLRVSESEHSATAAYLPKCTHNTIKDNLGLMTTRHSDCVLEYYTTAVR